MLQNLRSLQVSAKIIQNPSKTLNYSQTQVIPSPPILTQKLSRRDLTIQTTSFLSFLLMGTKAQAEEENNKQEEAISETITCKDKTPTKKAFFDISIDGEPVGRIIIGLYGASVPIGTSKFSNLITGAAGISYRRKEFIKIMPNYVQHGGVRSYGVDADLAKKTGSNLSVENLITEWENVNEKCPGTKSLAGSVSIIVRDPLKPPPKLKLIAREGKLEIDEEEVGSDPNGSEFVIITKDSPELDSSSLVIGRVMGGMEVVEKIAKVKTVQENTNSPYFRVAKLIGDKRAVVAERGFNRPYAKVQVTVWSTQRLSTLLSSIRRLSMFLRHRLCTQTTLVVHRQS